MLVAIALLLAGPVAVPAQRGDVVVVARDMRRWRAALIVEPGDVLRCRVTRSTGDAASDAEGCEAMQQCFASERPLLLAARQPSVTPARRRRLLADFRRELDGCFRAVSFRFATYPGAAPPEPDASGPERRK